MNVSKRLDTASYQDASQTLNGFITKNAGKFLPAVLILPAMYGIDEEAANAALNLEKEGYIAFIADIYGEGSIPKTRDEALKSAAWYKQNFRVYQRRISLALDQLTIGGAIPDKIAVIGYCFGGTGALEVLRGKFPVAGAVCVHGGLSKDPERKNSPLHAKVLIQHPANDQTVGKDDLGKLIDEMNESNSDWQLLSYGHCRHSFTNPQSVDYNEPMARRAWQHMLLFLQEVLK
ncbi:dienelactone hydrolase family protein [Algoriphagus sp. NG3]|uniref:dienelactone hydrolase family protein n=1 Tax=Algoriphagus sp. NG3 TaxID=3097546 RepID=UPI002A83C078|nr:dienelactone hydrolase family protein [Algoriphagus sp. NG3]WPR77353.1 dienelactone hydrolase family protein [Algoriphagus sp. NG3]